jgi:hypothetical protein
LIDVLTGLLLKILLCGMSAGPPGSSLYACVDLEPAGPDAPNTVRLVSYHPLAFRPISPSSMQNLAQELVDLVIDEVATTADTRDIGACALICRCWLLRGKRHLFSSILLSNADPTAIQALLLVDLLDASSNPILPFVKLLDMHLVNGPFTEAHMAHLPDCHAVRDLRIQATRLTPRTEWGPVEELPFQRWLQTYVPHFGSSWLSLTRFEFLLRSDLPMRLLADIICRFQSLTHLLLSNEGSYGVLQSEDSAQRTDPFPPHLHTLDLSLDTELQ